MTGASLSSRLHRGPEGLQAFDAARDLAAVVELLELGFDEDLDERDRRWLRDLSRISGAGPLLNLVVHTLPRARTAFAGFVWYAEGRLVGNVSLIRRPDEVWTIANVVTHPSARRRGIARRLMDAALLTAAQRGATSVELHVRQGNDAALALYDRLAFYRRGLTTSLTRPADAPPVDPRPVGAGFAVLPWRRPDDGRARRLLARVGRGELSGAGAALRSATRRGALRLRLDDWLHVRQRIALAASTGATYRGLALALCETLPISTHHLAFAIDPEWRGIVERPLVHALAHRLGARPSAPAEVSVSSEDPALEEALRDIGFEPSRTLVHLATDLADS